jgi:hypothetical protein
MRRIILRLVRRVRALGGERCDFCAIRMPRQASIVSVVEGARRVGVLCESCALDWLGNGAMAPFFRIFPCCASRARSTGWARIWRSRQDVSLSGLRWVNPFTERM